MHPGAAWDIATCVGCKQPIPLYRPGVQPRLTLQQAPEELCVSSGRMLFE